MLKLVLKHEGKEIICKVPSSWEEVTVAQFIRLETNREPLTALHLLDLLTEVDLSILENTRADLSSLINESLLFFSQDPPQWRSLEQRPFFVFAGKSYDVPKDLELERFGQKILLQTKIDELPEGDITPIIPYAVALYMQPIVYGAFESGKIEALEAEIMHSPIVDIFPISAFFFKKLNASIRLGKPILKQYQPSRTKPAS